MLREPWALCEGPEGRSPGWGGVGREPGRTAGASARAQRTPRGVTSLSREGEGRGTRPRQPSRPGSAPPGYAMGYAGRLRGSAASRGKARSSARLSCGDCDTGPAIGTRATRSRADPSRNRRFAHHVADSRSPAHLARHMRDA